MPVDRSPGDRRRAQRFEVRGLLAGLASSYRITIANISEGGCLAHASCMLKPNQKVQLQFVAEDGEEIRLQARVAHVTPVTGTPDTACVSGLEFLDADRAPARDAIRTLIALAVQQSTTT